MAGNQTKERSPSAGRGSTKQLPSSCRGFPQTVRENARRAGKVRAWSCDAAEPPINPSKCKLKCYCALQHCSGFGQLLSLQTQCNSSNRHQSLSLRGSASTVVGALLQRTESRGGDTQHGRNTGRETGTHHKCILCVAACVGVHRGAKLRMYAFEV